MHEQPVAGRDGSTSAISTVARAPSRLLAQREPARLVDAHDGHRNPVVAAGDAVLRAAGLAVEAGLRAGCSGGPHSITLAFSSSSSCS